MKSILLLGAIWALIPSVSAAAVYSDAAQGPRTNHPRQTSSDSIRQVRDGHHISDIRVRSGPQTIGTLDLAGTVSPGIILSISESTKLPGGGSVGSTISASCGSCFTTGTGDVTTDGVSFDDSIFKNPLKAAEEFFTDPLKLIQDSFDTEFELDLSNFTGHFEFDIKFSGTGTYDISIPLPDTPVGGSFPDPPLPAPAPGATVGLVPTIDIIFSVTGTAEITMGMDFSFPASGAWKIDPLKGSIVSTNFDEIQFTPLPAKVKSGSGTASASLKLGAKLAFDFHAFGEGFTLESGIFSDVPTYSATITVDPSAACEVAFTEQLAVDAGVFASAAVSVDGSNIGIGPKFVTTFATLSLPGACLTSSTQPANQTTTAISNSTITTISNYTTTAPNNYSITALPGSVRPTSGPVVLTSTFAPSSLATPIVGSYIVGTSVVNATSIRATPTS